jgi:hypothetical protein
MQINKSTTVGLFTFLLICFFTTPSAVRAQEVSLSISPPLTEITIQPGKSYSQTFTVKDDGIPVTIVPKIIPFIPLDREGHAELIENQNAVDSYSSWFSFDQTPISLGTTGSHDFIVKITPPGNIAEKDYYFTFIAAVQEDNNLGVNNSLSQARIGANLLINISSSGNPEKSASVINFSAAKIIDSFTGLTYKVLIGNSGSSFFKPVGKITVEQIFGKTVTLNLAPLNILVGGSRNISCLDGETLVPCKVPGKFLIGIYRSNLSFTVDGSGTSIDKQIYTIAFPFTIIIGLCVIFIIYRIVKRLIS